MAAVKAEVVEAPAQPAPLRPLRVQEEGETALKQEAETAAWSPAATSPFPSDEESTDQPVSAQRAAVPEALAAAARSSSAVARTKAEELRSSLREVWLEPERKQLRQLRERTIPTTPPQLAASTEGAAAAQ